MYSNSTEQEYWHPACKQDELMKKNRVLWRHNKSQIVVFISNNKVYAIDNRCPHEGYPLIQGEINPEKCTLTCQWHNWKFDIKSGDAKIGQDSVRTYPTKIENGSVWINLSPPSKSELSKKLLDAVKIGFEKHQYGRIARELVRFHFHKLDPLLALKEAIVWSHDKFEYGMTHAYAVCADWTHLYQRFEQSEEGLIALTEAMDHISFDVLRQPIFAYSEGQEKFQPKQFLEAIENENEAIALKQIRGAIKEKHSFATLQETLTQAALSHYNGFGHSLIYLVKIKELLEQLGEELTLPLLLAWVRSLIYTTREDLLPEFQDYAPLLIDWTKRSNTFGENKSLPDFSKLQGASVKEAMQWVLEQSKHHTPEALYQRLFLANAHNLLYFDMDLQDQHDNSVVDNIGWLDFTHALTFANAVRLSCEKHPRLWPQGLLQLAAFYGRNTPYLNLEQPLLKSSPIGDLKFWDNLYYGILDHGLGLPIFSSHLLKTTRAIEDELKVLPEQISPKTVLMALQRFIRGPIKQKHTRRTLFQSFALVGRDY